MTQPPLRLGDLPPEILDKIFSELDSIRSLADFIRTARFVYHRFKPRRETILFRVLRNALGPALADARFLSGFPYARPADGDRYCEWLCAMAAVYRDMLPRPRGLGVLRDPEGGGALLDGEEPPQPASRGAADPAPPPPPPPPGIEELTALCRAFRRINFLAELYATTQLGFFDKEAGDGPGDTAAATAPLSRAERHRVLRAFYRRQIVSNAWATTARPARSWTRADSHAFSNTRAGGGRRPGLLAAFDPWEMQHIDHADYFVMRVCRALVECAPAGEGEGEMAPRRFGELHAHAEQLAGHLGACPELAREALRGPRPRRSRAATERVQREYVRRYKIPPLGYIWQGDQTDNFPDAVFDGPGAGALRMDASVVGDGVGQVPFGWWDALRGHHVRRYGSGLLDIPWLPDRDGVDDEWYRTANLELWRHAGFALWDRERVEALKELDRFKRLKTGFLLERERSGADELEEDSSDDGQIDGSLS